MAYNNYKPSQKIPPVVLNLIIINAIVFLAQLVFDSTWPLTNTIALYPYGSGYFEPYQLVTHMFAHGGWLHIIFNMYALWLFGSVLERIWGPKKFLIFYLLCGLAAGLAQAFIVSAISPPAVGASGAIMGLLAGFAYTFPNTEFFIIPIPFPIKAKWMAAIYAGIDLFGGFSGGGDNIAHFAHLGGLAMGLILVILWNKTDKKTFY